MPSPQTGVFVCKLLAHPPLLLASLPPASCLSQAFVAQMKDALPQYVSLTTPCPPSATWTRFSTERLLEFDFFVQQRKFLASKIFANTKPTFLHLYFHFRVWSNFDSWHLLRRYFCVFIYNYLYLNLIFKINLHLYSQPGYERLCIGSWPPASPWATLTEALLRCDRPTSSTVCTTSAQEHVEETTWLKSWHIMFSFVCPTIRSDHSQISICIIEQSLVNDSQACYQFEWQQRICFVGLLPWSTDNPCSLPF